MACSFPAHAQSSAHDVYGDTDDMYAALAEYAIATKRKFLEYSQFSATVYICKVIMQHLECCMLLFVDTESQNVQDHYGYSIMPQPSKTMKGS